MGRVILVNEALISDKFIKQLGVERHQSFQVHVKVSSLAIEVSRP